MCDHDHDHDHNHNHVNGCHHQHPDGHSHASQQSHDEASTEGAAQPAPLDFHRAGALVSHWAIHLEQHAGEIEQVLLVAQGGDRSVWNRLKDAQMKMLEASTLLQQAAEQLTSDTDLPSGPVHNHR